MAENVDITVEIDLSEIGRSLSSNPDFLRLVAQPIRLQLSKDVRRNGNFLGKWAQRPVFTNANPNRLQ